MARRHRMEGDDPDEYWAVCEDCDGTGLTSFPVLGDDGEVEEGVTELGRCPGCDGLGFIDADADDFE